MIKNQDNELICSKHTVYSNFWQRTLGLMLKLFISKDEAFLFKFDKVGKYPIHTFFVCYPLDVIWLDEKLTVCCVSPNVKPFTPYKNHDGNAKYILEIRPNKDRPFVRMGEKLKFYKDKEV